MIAGKEFIFIELKIMEHLLPDSAFATSRIGFEDDVRLRVML